MMSKQAGQQSSDQMEGLIELANACDYSLLDTLKPDPEATTDGIDHRPRQVTSGHYVPVQPTPISDPIYVSHSQALFKELGLDNAAATSEAFKRMFSGDLSQLPKPMRRSGWATGYALSIFLVMNIPISVHSKRVMVMAMGELSQSTRGFF
ncbi:hypothetical protein QW180_18715 [Vibrio sinaloensis]|nr:hypothetical protein [Vibrio sinaloensis]